MSSEEECCSCSYENHTSQLIDMYNELKRKYNNQIKEIIEDLNDCLRLEDDGFGNKISCDCESKIIEKLKKWNDFLLNLKRCNGDD